MASYWRTALALALTLAAGGTALAAASDNIRPLVVQTIDENQLATLPGNVRPEASAANDSGAVAADRTLQHLQLQLRRSDEQESAVHAFVASQHDPASPNFHRWLTAAEFGQRFGTNQADIQSLTGWLKSHGLTVNLVYPSGMLIDFSGTAGQIDEAFHTSMHRLSVNGETHIANMSDPAIPAALSPVVAGVVSLNDFRPRKRWSPHPAYTMKGCGGHPCNFMAPADLATIYNFKPLFAAGITGKGQTIAVVEDTDLYSTADWTNFRSIFGLDGYTSGTLKTAHPAPSSGTNNCSDPGVNSDGDDVEATLDAEWSSAAAPNAAIEVAACDNTDATDGVTLAIDNLVNASSPPQIISVSYGECETENTAAGNAAKNAIYQQAVSEGISVFVATGDTGPSDCADFTNGTQYGIVVSGWATSEYDVAVGGTDFADTAAGTNSTYWTANKGAPWGTAKSYIPETPWNDTCASALLRTYEGVATSYGKKGLCNVAKGTDFLELGGGEGGPSSCFTGTAPASGVVGGTCKGNAKPSFQSGTLGMPSDGVRDIPDVSMFAADGVWNHMYLLCFTDPNNYGAACSGDPYNWGQGGGGTSYAAPIVAGIQALVNQHMGGKQGNPNPVYYKLAALEFGKTGNTNCYTGKGASSGGGCVFHDIIAGTDSQDCIGNADCYRPGGVTYGVLSTSTTANDPAFKAHVGYDLPTGLGTINAANLVEKWAKGL